MAKRQAVAAPPFGRCGSQLTKRTAGWPCQVKRAQRLAALRRRSGLLFLPAISAPRASARFRHTVISTKSVTSKEQSRAEPPPAPHACMAYDTCEMDSVNFHSVKTSLPLSPFGCSQVPPPSVPRPGLDPSLVCVCVCVCVSKSALWDGTTTSSEVYRASIPRHACVSYSIVYAVRYNMV
ncbi:hypothetical protein LZ31DRAFT_352499 [Colletotrichum somersetense]|nr:hypothetical protein LZ31DRAFT_352499 [Colletotrichum somersetense]